MKGLSNIGVVLLILLILIMFGVLPIHGYSHDWGYAPGGGVGIILLILLILLIAGAV